MHIVDFTSSGTWEFYLTHDHLYSPVAMLDTSGAVVERYEYDAYGKMAVLTDSDNDGNWFNDPDDTISNYSPRQQQQSCP